MLNYGRWQGHVINYEVKSTWMRILQFDKLKKLTKNAFKIFYSQKNQFQQLAIYLWNFFLEKCVFQNYTRYFNAMIGTFHNLKTFNQLPPYLKQDQKKKEKKGLRPPKVSTWPSFIRNTSLHKQSFFSIISNMFLILITPTSIVWLFAHFIIYDFVWFQTSSS